VIWPQAKELRRELTSLQNCEKINLLYQAIKLWGDLLQNPQGEWWVKDGGGTARAWEDSPLAWGPVNGGYVRLDREDSSVLLLALGLLGPCHQSFWGWDGQWDWTLPELLL
jgi:hypothetical protein